MNPTLPAVAIAAACFLAAVLLAVPVALAWLTEGRRARAQRLRAYGWTQSRIAAHLGCSRRTVGRLLAGTEA